MLKHTKTYSQYHTYTGVEKGDKPGGSSPGNMVSQRDICVSGRKVWHFMVFFFTKILKESVEKIRLPSQKGDILSSMPHTNHPCL